MVTGNPTIRGGVSHGSHLTQAEREAASKVLAKLKNSGTNQGASAHSTLPSATMYGGSSTKIGGLSVPTLMGGHGSDTFIGGARGAAHPLTSFGNDTVVSGSAATFGGHAPLPELAGASHIQPFHLGGDTINAAGATAESVKAAPPHDAISTGHTITLGDNTTITISGLSQHDLSKLTHH